MSLNGKLEDVSLADVMQFIHLGRRTGTLSLVQGNREAEIGFHRGQIVSASGPGTRRLGELLIADGLITPEQLRSLIEQQKTQKPRQSLGQLLVSNDILAFSDIRRAIEKQIEETIYELVTWTTGSFEFALDELRPIDDIAMYPGDVIPQLDLNTQMVLLEATRIFDERRRTIDAATDAGAALRGVAQSGMASRLPEVSPETPRPTQRVDLPSVAETLEGLEDIDLGQGSDEEEPEPQLRRLQIVSADRRFADQVAEIVPADMARVVRVPLREAGTRLPGEPSPTIVVLDLRDGNHSIEDLLAVRRSRPRSSVIALIDSQELTRRAFEAGAVAAIPGDPEALAACFTSLVRTLQDASGGTAGNRRTVRAGFARLRRVLADIRSGLLSATMALNLMHVISESVERAVLFLVRDDHLLAIGAFGFGANGEALAEETRNFTISLDADNVLTHCISDGQLRAMSFDQANLPDDFAALLGRPRSGQVVVFPVLGAERVISVVYTDNGSSNRAIEDIELLELATAQVGVAFENELLRRQLQRGV
ncbi:MAG: DUF4388 domain-containing protein [Acidobacteria bacterium]|nr:MAG: DUF4388 domain-containing protein [Acidobacteriota bacterium]